MAKKKVSAFSGKISDERFSYDRRLREEAVGRVEILGKVKELFTIPELDLMPILEVAQYFDVTDMSIRRYLKEFKEEFDEDGVRSVTAQEIGKMLDGNGVRIVKGIGISEFTFPDGRSFKYPNRGTTVLTRRAVLRLGMLMRGSLVAKEIRTQLLNTFENSDDVSHTLSIDEENDLLVNLMKAFTDGTPDQILVAAQGVYQYQNRHIDELEKKIAEVSEDNELLAGKILSWTRPSKLNKAIRIIAGKGQVPAGFIWRAFYDELRYKHGIGLSQRGEKPYIQHIHEDEWPVVQQSLSAICEAHGVSPSYVFKRAKLIEA